MTPTPKSIYESGRCTIKTYHDEYHELWYGGRMVAYFRVFRNAVRYQLNEFP